MHRYNPLQCSATPADLWQLRWWHLVWPLQSVEAPLPCLSHALLPHLPPQSPTSISHLNLSPQPLTSPLDSRSTPHHLPSILSLLLLPLLSHMASALDDNFNSSDLEFEEAPPDRFARAGVQPVNAMLENASALRIQSKRAVKQLLNGSPNTRVQRLRWANSWNAFYSEVLKQSSVTLLALLDNTHTDLVLTMTRYLLVKAWKVFS